MMDEYYSVRLSGEVTRGMTEKAKRGGYQARPPLGYKIQERGKPPVIVPEEAEIIKIIFDKYVNEHTGIFDIARYLNLCGFKTSHNKPFERRSIEYILQNPTYCGMIRWNRTVSETNEIRPESEWIVSMVSNLLLYLKNYLTKHRSVTKANTNHPAPDLPLHTNIGFQVL